MGLAPHFEPRFIDYALNNLRVKKADQVYGKSGGEPGGDQKKL